MYKAAKHVEKLIDSLLNWHQESIDLPFHCHLLIIDDGSQDEGIILAKKKLENGDFPYTLLQLSKNSGQHTALSVGLNYSESDWIVTLDDDLQHDPNYISLLWERAKQTEADVIYGYFLESKHSPWRNLASSTIRTLTKLFIFDYSKVTSFRFIRSTAIQYFKEQVKTSFLIDSQIIPTTKRIQFVAVPHHQKVNNTSRYNFQGLVLMSLKIWLWHSPLSRWNWIKHTLLPNPDFTIDWIDSSCKFESFPLQHHHIQMVRKWRNSSFVNQQMDYREEISEEQQEKWYKTIDSTRQFYFVHRYRGEWVGFSHIHTSLESSEGPSLKIGENGGFVCSPKWQGSGIPVAIALETLDFAFNSLSIDRLRIKVNSSNVSAIELNKALGYKFTHSITTEFNGYELQQSDYMTNVIRMRKLLRFL
jgi:glycosyltransferase involved in cell wall biosynthesis